MASSEQFLEYVLDLLSLTTEVRYRKMMGEYVLYSKGKVFGGIYDDRFLLKLTPVTQQLLPEAPLETPYPGAKQMLLVESQDPQAVAAVVEAMLPELPEPKGKKN